MIQSNDLRAGMTILHENNIYQVLGTSQNKTAQRQMIIKAKVKNMRTDAIVELTFIGGDKIEPAHIDKKEMQFLYDSGEGIVFMDQVTYDQIEIPKDKLEWELNFIKEGESVTVIVFESEVLGLSLPDKVKLEVTESEPAVKGDTATNAQKNAIVETGLEIRVPLFIEQGEMVLVSTEDGKYAGRA